MNISNRLAGTAAGDSLVNLAARAARRSSEEVAAPDAGPNLSGGSYDPAARVSLSVDALLALTATKGDGEQLPALTEDERNDIASPALLDREYQAFGRYLEAGDAKAYHRAYLQYFDSLRPEDQASARYAGTRDTTVAALQSISYSESAAELADDGESRRIEAVVAARRVVQATSYIQPASMAPLAYDVENVARYSGRISRANNMYVTGF